MVAADTLRNGGADLRLTPTTLGKRLDEKGFLITAPSRGTLTTRKNVGDPSVKGKARVKTWKIAVRHLNT